MDSSRLFCEKALNLSQVGDGGVAVDPGLVLLPTEENSVLQIGSGKWYTFLAGGPSSFEMVLTLLAEIIAFHV